MPKRTLCIRAVYDGHQQRGRCGVRHPIRFLALGVVPCTARSEVGLQHGPIAVGVARQNCIALPQQARHFIHHAGGVAAVNDLQARKTVFGLTDIHKAAAGNEGRQHCAVKQHIRIVHAINGVQVKIIVPELPPEQAVRQRIHGLAAPAQHLCEGAELWRCHHAEVLHGVLHFIIFVAGLHPRPLLQQAAAQVCHAFQVAHRAVLSPFARKYSQYGTGRSETPLGGGYPPLLW